MIAALCGSEAAACVAGTRCITVETPAAPAAPGAPAAPCTTGARCITVPQAELPEPVPAPFAPGETLEPGSYTLVMGTDRLGLDPPRDGWVYVAVDDWVLKVDWQTRTVIEDVTSEMPAWFTRRRR